MINFIQQFFLNPYLIFLILLVAFVVISYWAIRHRREFIGYGLGWLIGIFGVVVYGALVGDTTPVIQPGETAESGMNILQVVIPSIIGMAMGAWSIWVVIQSRKTGMLRSIAVALLTCISFWLIIFLAIAAPYVNTQRMIGLFTWAFGIGALSMIAIYVQGGTQMPAIRTGRTQTANPDTTVGNGNNQPRRNVPAANIDDSTSRRFGDRSDRR